MIKNKVHSILLSFVFLLVSLLILSSFNTSINKTEKKKNSSIEKYTWLYKFRYDSDNESLIRNNKKMGISHLIVNVNPNMLYPDGNKKSRRYTASFIDFMDRAKKENIKLHLMIMEDYSFALQENHDKAKLKVEQFVAFINENLSYLQNPIVGLHCDVEPHALKEWHKEKTWAAKEKILNQYLQMLTKINRQMKSTTLKNGKKLSILQFSASIATWLDSKARDGKLPSGSPEKFKEVVDFIVPMTYLEPSYARAHSTQSKIDKIIRNVSGEIDGCPTVIGLDADNFDSFENISEVTTKLDQHFKDYSNYKGVCYFRYASLIEFYESNI